MYSSCRFDLIPDSERVVGNLPYAVPSPARCWLRCRLQPPERGRVGGSTPTQEGCNNSAQMSYEYWLVTTATIDSCEWKDPPSETPSSLFVGCFTVVFSYAVDGNHYRGIFHSSHAWEIETEVGILYNPQNPVE